MAAIYCFVTHLVPTKKDSQDSQMNDIFNLRIVYIINYSYGDIKYRFLFIFFNRKYQMLPDKLFNLIATLKKEKRKKQQSFYL